MSDTPNKVLIPTAVTKHSSFALRFQHVTSANFMDFTLAAAFEVVPDAEYDLKHLCFTRMEALKLPTFGDARVNSRMFFVPFRTIMPAWNDFDNDCPHAYPDGSHALVPYTHRIKLSQILNLLTYTGGTYPAISETGDIKNDIFVNRPNEVVGYKFTAHGSRVVKLLMQLGYGINYNERSLLANEEYVSALPFLSMLKVYLDWYFPSAYVSDEYAMIMSDMVNYDSTIPFEEYCTYDKLLIVFDFITKVNYDSDYFVSAWDNPVAPNYGSYSSVKINDVTVKSGIPHSEVNLSSQTSPDSTSTGTPTIRTSSTNGSASNLTEYMLDSLKALTDYTKRNQLAGARPLDRYLARWGVQLSSEKLKRSVYLGSHSEFMDFGDVTSTSDTDGARLGDYAGKGVCLSKGGTIFKFDEKGYFIIVTSPVTQPCYYQGADKCTLHTSRLDFYTPEFDNLGVQALETRELFMPMDSRLQYPANSTEYPALDYNKCVFGFVPRYGEYKRSRSMITGDYRLGSRNGLMGAWTLFRDVEPFFKEGGIEGTKHDVNFVKGTDSNQYNRLFYVTNDSYDHLFIHHQFIVKVKFPGSSLYDDYEFEDEDNAKKVSVDLNGVKAN